MNSPSSIDPRMTGSPEPGPTYSIETQSARSEKKYGTTVCSSPRPSMLNAAVLPWLNATSQCSIRIGLPCTGLWYSQMSPAANTFGCELSSPAEQATPPCSPISSPAAFASETSGVTPMPTTTKSQSSSSPLFVTTLVTREPSPSKRSTSSPPCTCTPCSSSASWKKCPTFSPKNGSKVTSSSITTWHSTPCAAVSDAATSQPM